MQYLKTILISLFLPAIINAQEQTNVVAKGKIFWTFSSDSVLTVTGEGVMPDFRFGPGYELYRNKIKEVVIGEGTMRVGRNTAAGNLYPNIQKVTMPNTVTSIGIRALGNGSSTTSVTLSENLEEMDERAVEYYEVAEIRLPKSLQKIGKRAFNSYDQISFGKVHVEWDEPLAVEASNITTINDIFYSYAPDRERTLYVPPGTEERYRAAPIWGDFTYILPEPGPSYTVTFDSQGGSEVAPLAGVEQGSTIAEPEAPTKENFIFSEWYSGADAIKWDFATSTVVSDTTLYAKWDVASAINFPAVATKIILSGEQIIIDGLNGVQLFSLSDLTGKLLISCMVSNGSSISIASLPQGWYIIRTGNETQRWQKI